MTTIHFGISPGTPSAHYTDEDFLDNGALDYDVTLTIGGGITHHCSVCGVEYPDGNNLCHPSTIVDSVVRSYLTIEGGITLYRDHDGTMSPCGTPRDGWVSGSILVAIDRLGEDAAREILRHLAGGDRSNGVEITVDTEEVWRIGDLVEGGSGEDYDDGRVVEIDGDQITIAWASSIRTTQHKSLLRR